MWFALVESTKKVNKYVRTDTIGPKLNLCVHLGIILSGIAKKLSTI